MKTRDFTPAHFQMDAPTGLGKWTAVLRSGGQVSFHKVMVMISLLDRVWVRR